MAFSTIHTAYGLARIAAAEASGIPINLTHMAVGDGGGSPTEPDIGQTTLVNERDRFEINTVIPDVANPNQFYIEAVIPPDVGGWTIREIGIYDDDGQLFAVGNFPETYKTVPSDGAVNDLVIRTSIIVDNAAVITIILDPNVAIATRAWVMSNFSTANLLPGGTTGQVLRKVSNIDGDTEWADPADANVFVNVLEDRGELADGQRTILLVNCTTRGLAVYIGGARIPRGPGEYEWEPSDVDEDTTVVLGRAYPAGTVYICAQNEPNGSSNIPLERDKNLSDVPDKALGRTNLGVYSKAEVDARGTPPGAIMHFARATAPSGFLKANGANVSRTAYPELFAVIGTTFGAGDGTSTFTLPDLRGEFIRGLDDGRGVDSGRSLGSEQTSANRSHSHSASTSTDGSHTHSLGGYVGRNIDTAGTRGSLNVGTATQNVTNAAGSHSHSVSVSSSGGSEARPRNIAMLACIKF